MKQILGYLSTAGILGTALLGFFSVSPHASNASVLVPQILAKDSSDAFEKYRKQCLERVRREGLRGEVGNELCNCVISQFRSRYSIAEFQQLLQQAKQDKTAARKLSQIGESCFDSVLYEE